MRTTRNAFTQAKAWRADTPRRTRSQRYRDAAKLVGYDNVVVQELIPGGGEAQFSYAALWHHGKPVAELTARRTRQYPVDFSYTSTFVEIVANDKVKAAATALLTAVAFEGLVEVEFKFDARDEQFKVLDVNPRAWSWLALCESAGCDLALMMSCVAAGLAVTAAKAAARPRLDPHRARHRRGRASDDPRPPQLCRLRPVVAAEADLRKLRVGRSAARHCRTAADRLARAQPRDRIAVAARGTGESSDDSQLSSNFNQTAMGRPGQGKREPGPIR